LNCLPLSAQLRESGSERTEGIKKDEEKNHRKFNHPEPMETVKGAEEEDEDEAEQGKEAAEAEDAEQQEEEEEGE
jgi:hypothetical protein